MRLARHVRRKRSGERPAFSVEGTLTYALVHDVHHTGVAPLRVGIRLGNYLKTDFTPRWASFDKLRMSGTGLIPLVVSLSNHVLS